MYTLARWSMARAFRAGHPKSLDVYTSPLVADTVKANFIDEPFEVARTSADFFKKWTKGARELQAAEEAANDTRPKRLRDILRGERLLLWKEILVELGYPDDKVIDEASSGFHLHWWAQRSGVFPPRVRRPAMSTATLKTLSSSLFETVRKRLLRRQERDIQDATWAETQDELAKGWIFKHEDHCMEHKVVAVRFGLWQGQKIRVIDDCSICGLNATVGFWERLQVHSIDILANMLQLAMRTTPKRGSPRHQGKNLRSQVCISPVWDIGGVQGHVAVCCQ